LFGKPSPLVADDQRPATQVDESLFQPRCARRNGKQTIGENIGDLTGVVVGHEAYLLYVEDHGGVSPILDGFTGDQRYFLSWAQAWRCLYTPESYRTEIIQGYHSPAQYRVNGVVRNIDDWY
jgi:putative endopeptidase